MTVVSLQTYDDDGMCSSAAAYASPCPTYTPHSLPFTFVVNFPAPLSNHWLTDDRKISPDHQHRSAISSRTRAKPTALCNDSILPAERGLRVAEEEGGWYVISRGMLTSSKDCRGEEERRWEMEQDWSRGISRTGKIRLRVAPV